MQIYLLRPSRAAVDTGSEAHRHLSLEGRQVIRAIGNKVRLTEEPSFDRIIASPLAAAIQSAELFADRTDYVGMIEVLPLLTAETPPSIIAPILLETKAAMGKESPTILVCADEPALAMLGAFLVGRPTFPPAVHGQVSVITNRKPDWCLRPGEMRQLLLVA